MGISSATTVATIYEAFAGGDMETARGMMHPDIVWNEAEGSPYADGNPYIGPAAVEAGVFLRCAQEWEGFALEIDQIFEGESVVIATGHYVGTFLTTQRSQKAQFAHLWWIEGGKAVRFQQYTDTLQVSRVMGTA